MTNEYFYKYGLSRQAVQYQIKKGDIKPFSEVKGMFLYYQYDADLLILNYWMNNFKRFELEDNSAPARILMCALAVKYLRESVAMGFDDSRLLRSSDKYMELLERSLAYRESGLSFEGYLKKEKYFRAKGLSYREIHYHFSQKYANKKAPIKEIKNIK